MRGKLYKAVLMTGAVCAGLVAGASIASADTLVFSGNDYDVVTSASLGTVPNVNVTFSAPSGTSWAIYNLATTAFPNGVPGTTNIPGEAALWINTGSFDLSSYTAASAKVSMTLTADPGYNVVFNSLDLSADQMTSQDNIANITITDGNSNQLYTTPSGGFSFQGDGQSPTYSTFAPSSALQAQQLTITFNYVPDYNTSMNDLNFSQVAVPEPACLMLLGLGSLALIRRRKCAV